MLLPVCGCLNDLCVHDTPSLEWMCVCDIVKMATLGLVVVRQGQRHVPQEGLSLPTMNHHLSTSPPGHFGLVLWQGTITATKGYGDLSCVCVCVCVRACVRARVSARVCVCTYCGVVVLLSKTT